jgi:hypothetical protein
MFRSRRPLAAVTLSHEVIERVSDTPKSLGHDKEHHAGSGDDPTSAAQSVGIRDRPMPPMGENKSFMGAGFRSDEDDGRGPEDEEPPGGQGPVSDRPDVSCRLGRRDGDQDR